MPDLIVDAWTLERSKDGSQVKIPEAQLRAAGWVPATEKQAPCAACSAMEETK